MHARTLPGILAPDDGPPSDRPLRVLVVTSVYPWAGNPDEGIFVHRQLRALEAAGARCRVLHFRAAPRGLPRALAPLTWLRHHPRWLRWPRALDGIPVETVFYPTPLRRPRGVEHARWAGDALAAHVARDPEAYAADVVYAQWLWPGGAAALPVGTVLDAPVAAEARGSDMHWWHELHPECGPQVTRVLRQAALLLANCEGLRRRAGALVPGSEHRTAVVYNGADPATFGPAPDVAAARRALGLPEQARVLLCCGRVQRRKGSHDLAEAWEALADGALRDWILLVVGPIVERAAAARLRAAGRRTGGRVRVVGPVRADAVVRYLHAADALVHPTHAEGLANVTIEAMLAGLPVVSTTADGQPEAVEHGVTGWLVPPHDQDALRSALTELAGDAGRARRMGAAGRRAALARFDAREHALRLVALLRGAASAHRASRSDPTGLLPALPTSHRVGARARET